MADILIRGMTMPGSCRECIFAGFGGIRFEVNVCMFSGESQSLLSNERMSKCPLVPLQEGHGRLIDADALVADTSFFDGGDWHYGYSAKQIQNAPTILEAEGG